MSEGMYHNEGGWRPDVNPTDSNQLMRWRRKIEKDDHYVTQMVKISNVSISAADDPSVSQSGLFLQSQRRPLGPSPG